MAKFCEICGKQSYSGNAKCDVCDLAIRKAEQEAKAMVPTIEVKSIGWFAGNSFGGVDRPNRKYEFFTVHGPFNKGDFPAQEYTFRKLGDANKKAKAVRAELEAKAKAHVEAAISRLRGGRLVSA